MCGICGRINFDGKPVAEELLRDMCAAFEKRGPDAQGYYSQNGAGLGHKRLSIMDLSDSGLQPMCNEDSRIWTVYNGEIYKFGELAQDLKNKGHVFTSDSDTEVILHLYEEEGIDAVKQLNGMFAFAVWDEDRSRLWACRDRVGIKPFVYYHDDEKFIFASEIKALLKNPDVPKEIDYNALYLYTTFSYVPAPYTIFKGIKKLEPGCSLILEKGEVKIQRYWDAPLTEDTDITGLSFDEQKKLLFETLNQAVKDRMIADVPLGAFLSGGIDSSIIVALMARNSTEKVKTFSIGFKDAQLFDETHYAREVAELYNTDHHEFKLDYKDMLQALPEVLTTFDEPFSDSSAIPTFIVSRETRKHVTVALSGDGGDELFAGYRSYLGEYLYPKYHMIPAVLREKVIERLFETLPDSRDARVTEYIRRIKKFIKGSRGTFPERLLSIKEIFPMDLRSRLFVDSISNGPVDLALEWVEKKIEPYDGDGINTMLYSDLKDSLPGDMLTKVDWMSMKNSLEVRVPLLDHRVVELAFKMQGNVKLHRGRTKFILKDTFRDMLPKSLYNRPKAGFEVPISIWLKTDLKFLLTKYLSEEKIRDQGIFDYEVVENLIRDFLGKKTDTSWMLWNLIVFMYWSEHYL